MQLSNYLHLQKTSYLASRECAPKEDVIQVFDAMGIVVSPVGLRRCQWDCIVDSGIVLPLVG